MATAAAARPPTSRRKLTPEEFLDLEDGVAYEMCDDGTLKERNVGMKSEVAAGEANGLLGVLLRRQRRGYLITSGVGLQIFDGRPRRVPRADGGFISRTRLPGGMPPDGFLTVAPELLIESLSPGDRALEVEAKIREYLSARVLLVWVINPEQLTVTVWRADGTITALNADDTITGEDVLPGFSCTVRDFFPWVAPQD